MAEAKFRHLVRIANTDLKGELPIAHALRKIKGVGFMISNFTCKAAGVDRTKKAGTLEETEVRKIETVIRNPMSSNIPNWMLNRRKDYLTGEDKHIITTDLDFTQSNDKRRLQKVKSYRGLRLAWGLPVRGQRTKSNFRRNKGKGLGVKKKAKGK